MASEATVREVRDLLVTTLGIEERRATIDAATPLFGNLPELDSLAVVELVQALEDEFDLVVEDSELGGEVFESVGSLADFVEGKRHDRAA